MVVLSDEGFFEVERGEETPDGGDEEAEFRALGGVRNVAFDWGVLEGRGGVRRGTDCGRSRGSRCLS